MPDDNQDITNILQRFAERAGKIKLAGGLVGKMTQIAIASSTGLATVACLTKSPTIEGICIILIAIVVIFIVWKSLAFAEKNPATAILEGAELIEYHKVIQETKYPLQIEDIEARIIIGDPLTTPITPTPLPDRPDETVEVKPIEGKESIDG